MRSKGGDADRGTDLACLDHPGGRLVQTLTEVGDVERAAEAAAFPSAAMLVRLPALVASGCVSVAPSDTPSTSVCLICHAEKVAMLPDGPPLTPEGTARAAALADVLAQAGVVAVYNSQFRQAYDTAAPLADRLEA